jgi:hypothetical protein
MALPNYNFRTEANGARWPSRSSKSVAPRSRAEARFDSEALPPFNPQSRNPQFTIRLTLDESNVAGAWTFLGVLGRELDALTFAKQLEHRAADRASMEEVLDPAFVADKPKPFVD